MKFVTLTETIICWSLALSDKSSCLCYCLVVGPWNGLPRAMVTLSSCWHSRSVGTMPVNIGFEFWVDLCGDRSWTWWSLWIPSNSEDSMLLKTSLNSSIDQFTTVNDFKISSYKMSIVLWAYRIHSPYHLGQKAGGEIKANATAAKFISLCEVSPRKHRLNLWRFRFTARLLSFVWSSHTKHITGGVTAVTQLTHTVFAELNLPQSRLPKSLMGFVARSWSKFAAWNS